MGDPTKDTIHKIITVTWLLLVSVLGFIKIVVGIVNIDDGCLGLWVLPYYLLIGGLLSMVPAAISFLASFTGQAKDLEDLWEMMANVFMVSLLYMIVGTVYILTNAMKATHLDRLCTQTWVPIFTLFTLCVDWGTLVLFYRLFCLNDVPETPTEPVMFTGDDDSPFRLWKQRQQSRRNV